MSQPSVLHPKLGHEPQYVVQSHGNYLTTWDGLEIFDATAGAAVASIGHNDHRIKDAIIQQLSCVAYCYAPFFTTQAAEDICRFLTDSTNGEMSKVFITSSGTEAVEAALKMACQYFNELPKPQPGRCRYIARRQSYHGNTLGSLATGGHPGRRSIYESILASNVSHVSPCYAYRDMKQGETNEEYVGRLADELDEEFRKVGPDTVCAFVAETVSGTSLGCATPVPGYLKAMKAVCERYGALFILDEVMSGMGRTGTLHAWEQEDVIPDLQTVAKGLGGGYMPVGALMINRRVVETLEKGTGSFIHSQTYQGHPMACASAYAVQKIIQEEKMLANVRNNGEYFGQLLRDRLGDHKNVGDIRGRGFFWGLEFVQNKETKEPFPSDQLIAAKMHKTGLQAGYCISLIPSTGNVDGKRGDMVLLSPAYNVTRADLELIADRTAKVVHAVLGNSPVPNGVGHK